MMMMMMMMMNWLSDLLQSELKNKIIESWGGARAPVPYSWRRHWLRLLTVCRLTEQI